MPAKKEEIRVFVEGPILMMVDSLIGVLGNTRSEVVRSILQNYLMNNPENVERLEKIKERAKQTGYLTT